MEISDNNGAGMTNHHQFVLRLGPAISFHIEIGDNNGAGMTDHFIPVDYASIPIDD